MIDTATENLLALRDVPRCLPPRPNGRPLHISAVYRWTLRGLKGVRLDTVKIGGTTYTSREAIQRFSERLSGADPSPPRNVGRSRQRQIDRVNAAVSKALGLGDQHSNSE